MSGQDTPITDFAAIRKGCTVREFPVTVLIRHGLVPVVWFLPDVVFTGQPQFLPQLGTAPGNGRPGAFGFHDLLESA